MFTISTIFSYLIPAIVVLVVLKIISLPFKLLISFLINLLLGGIILFALTHFGIISVTLTWWMTAIVGIFGVPGAVGVAILSFFI